MNFTFEELNELFNKIKSVLDVLEKNKQYDKSYTLYLANGEQINYDITKGSIAHLLGININYLVGTSIFKEKAAYQLLCELIENPYRVHEAAKNGIIDYKYLFSDFVTEKVEHILENIKINVTDVEFVCSYDKSRTYHMENTPYECDYILVKSCGDDRIGVLTFKKNGFNCQLMSNRTYDNYESAKKDLDIMLKNQVITLLNGMKVIDNRTDESKKFFLYNNNKTKKLEGLKEYSVEYKAYPVTISDHIRDYKNYDNIYDDVPNITGSITQNKPIEGTNSKLLDPIIRAFNDFLYRSGDSNTNITESYSKKIDELKELRKAIEKLAFEKAELSNEVKNQKIRIQELTSENDEVNKKLCLIKEIINDDQNKKVK